MAFGRNPFPDKRVPEVYTRLDIVHFFAGGVTYADLSDGELFNAAYTYMHARNAADQIIAQRNQPKGKP